MNLGETGVVFICVLVGCVFGVLVYFFYLHFYLVPDILAHGLRAQEHRLQPSLFGIFLPPIGLFLFAWTARASIPWIVPTIGIAIHAGSVFVILQCIFFYLPMSYPSYAASLFAGNDFCRSSFAAGSIVFSRPMFDNLGIGQGVSLLAGLSVVGVFGLFSIYTFGAALRAKSKFAVS